MNNRKISGLTGDKTTFVLAENSYIYANQLRIFTSKNSYLNNKGTIGVVANKAEIDVMSIKADNISNKHIISALGVINDNEYIIPSSINITTKHLITTRMQDAGIKASEGIVTLETYKGKGYFDENIKQKFYKLN